MKKDILIICIAALIITSMEIANPDRALSQEKVILKVASLAPGGSDWMKNFNKAIKEIKKKTNGRISIKVYPGGIMGNDATVLRKIRIKQLDGASFTAGGIAMIYPDFQVMSMPFLFSNYKEVDFVRSKIDPLIMKNLETKGYVSLVIIDTGFVYMLSNHPISNLDSLKGHKVWIPEGDPIGNTVFDLAGVPPIPLPIADVLTGLQTGLIDTVSCTPSGTLLLQWYTKIKYLTDLPVLYGYATLVLSKKAYQKIPEKDRQIVRDVIKKKMSALSKSNRKFNKQSLKVLKKHGIKFITMDSKSKTEIEAFGKKVRESLLDQNLFSKEIASTLLNALSEYRKKTKK